MLKKKKHYVISVMLTRTYKNLIDFQVESLMPHAEMISQQIAAFKKKLL